MWFLKQKTTQNNSTFNIITTYFLFISYHNFYHIIVVEWFSEVVLQTKVISVSEYEMLTNLFRTSWIAHPEIGFDNLEYLENDQLKSESNQCQYHHHHHHPTTTIMIITAAAAVTKLENWPKEIYRWPDPLSWKYKRVISSCVSMIQSRNESGVIRYSHWTHQSTTWRTHSLSSKILRTNSNASRPLCSSNNVFQFSSCWLSMCIYT